MRKFLVALLFSFLAVNLAQASTTASVSRSTLPVGETLMLRISTQGTSASKPDFEALEKDFKIYSQNYVSNISVVNGKSETSVNWELILMPKGKGELTIPAFDVDGSVTKPITIKVLDSASAIKEGQKEPRYSLKARISNNNPYVQQEIIYKLSLIDSGGLQGSEPTFDGSKDWVIRTMGQPDVRQFVVEGKKMREIVFTYALFPQRSGVLETPTAQFEGYYLSKSKQKMDSLGSLFDDEISNMLLYNNDLFATRNPISLSVEPIKVNVKAVPSDNGGRWWLPSKKVIFAETWDPKDPVFRVGEAVNRTVYLKAEGVIETQLPEIKFKNIRGMKQYPEKPETEMQAPDGSVISISKVSNVYIPSMSGKMTLPAVDIDWFDVDNRKYEKATLPAKEIMVEATAKGQLSVDDETVMPAVSPKVEKIQDQTMQQRGDNLKNAVKEAATLIEGETAHSGFNSTEIVILLVGAFGLGIVICYLLIKPKKETCETTSQNDYKKQIIKSAKAKDLRSLRDAILGWTAQKYEATQVSNFNDVNKLLKNKEFADELDKITAELYSENSQNWDSKTFLNCFERADQKKVNPQKEAKLLPDLYK